MARFFFECECVRMPRGWEVDLWIFVGNGGWWISLLLVFIAHPVKLYGECPTVVLKGRWWRRWWCVRVAVPPKRISMLIIFEFFCSFVPKGGVLDAQLSWNAFRGKNRVVMMSGSIKLAASCSTVIHRQHLGHTVCLSQDDGDWLRVGGFPFEWNVQI